MKTFNILNHEVQMSFNAKQRWSHCKLHKREGIKHFVWGRVSIYIEDLTSEHYELCTQCNSSDIGEVQAGDEGWTVCQDCGATEQGYKYVTKLEYERLT